MKDDEIIWYYLRLFNVIQYVIHVRIEMLGKMMGLYGTT